MASRHPTKVEQFAIEAKLNLILGAEVYDRVFQGFEVLEVANAARCSEGDHPRSSPAGTNYGEREQPA